MGRKADASDSVSIGKTLKACLDAAQAQELAARAAAWRVVAQAGPRASGDRLALADAAALAHGVVDHPGERTQRIDRAEATLLLDLRLAVDDQLDREVGPVERLPGLDRVADHQ